MRPQRVPMVRPSSGEKVMVVATERPLTMPHIDAPLPRCATITRRCASSGAMPANCATIDSYERPWKP
ncbi:Uncharacterised protein [Mycobacterium tuberculosis]|nr:Uncharacterised protein [Mycobacterium tuberculosis]